MRYHDFKLLEDSRAVNTWPGVKPGDLVHSPFAIAWKFKHIHHRTDRNALSLRDGLLLVLAIVDGPPDDSQETDVRSVYVLSRHGVLCLVQPTS